MTQEKQDRDEIKWVTKMTAVLGFELRDGPHKQDVPKADIALTLMDAGRERRIDVEVVEAIDQLTRAGYNGACKLLVYEVTDELRRRGLNANVGLEFDNGVLGLMQQKPKERRLLASKLADLVADTLVRPHDHKRIGWMWRDREPLTDRGGLEYLGLLSTWGIKFVRAVTVTLWLEPVVITAVGGPMDGPHLIQEAIDKKVTKRAKYVASTSDAEEVWLLVVGGHGTGSLLPTHVAERRTFTSPFARTYFLEAGEGACVPLKTTAGSE